MYGRVSLEHIAEQFGIFHSDGKVGYSETWRVIIVGIRCTLCLSMCADSFEDIPPNWMLVILQERNNIIFLKFGYRAEE